MKILNYSNISNINNNCEHEFVYNKPNTFFMTQPTNLVCDRICKKCGQLDKVMVEDMKYTLINEEEFYKTKTEKSYD